MKIPWDREGLTKFSFSFKTHENTWILDSVKDVTVLQHDEEMQEIIAFIYYIGEPSAYFN